MRIWSVYEIDLFQNKIYCLKIMSDRLSESMSIAQKSDWTILYENKDLKG